MAPIDVGIAEALQSCFNTESAEITGIYITVILPSCCHEWNPVPAEDALWDGGLELDP